MRTSSILIYTLTIVLVLMATGCKGGSYSGPLLGRWKFIKGERRSSEPGVVGGQTVGDTGWTIKDEIEFFPNGTVTNDWRGPCDFWIEKEGVLSVSCGFGVGNIPYRISGSNFAIQRWRAIEKNRTIITEDLWTFQRN